MIPAVQPEAPPRLVVKRKTGHEYYVDHRGDEFWIRTNDKGKNFRLVRAPAMDPAQKNWKQVLPHRKLVMLEDMDLFKGFWVAKERDDGLLKLRITDFGTGEHHYIDMPEAVYSTGPGTNAEFDTATFRFVYQSYITPRTTYDYDLAKRTRKLLKQQPVLGGYKPEEYDSAMLMATARDGTKIPVSLVWKKDLRKDGAAAVAPVRLWLLRLSDGRGLPFLAPVAAGPRRGVRDRAHPRRRRPRAPLVRRRQAREEDEHLHRLHRRGGAPGGEGVDRAGPAGDRGRQRGRAARWGPSPTCVPTCSGRS